MKEKKALICGVSGQDGAYLSKLLLNKGYIVFGGSRDAQNVSFQNLAKLNILDNINLVSITLNDFRSVLQTINKVEPDEIYNLAGQSSVALSFEQPVETMESITIGTLNILEAIRFSGRPIKFYNAGSSECFGNADHAVDEETPFRPRSPYGVAKATAFWQVSNYREAYNLFACTGILFNHESPLRKERFVTKKIISTAYRIFKGENIKLRLGNINIRRDWGWAPEYVEAMWLMLQNEIAQDFVIATGKTTSLQDFIRITFELLGLNWKDHVEVDELLLRPTDISVGLANPQKAKEILGWNAKVHIENIIRLMLEDEKTEDEKKT
ncbi:GDP-mannose 4,6-dehydratase [Pedobacter psychrophilus]|uniref:GDP-mannose 4,6-dehydratase n=1 Tax=Pedobacter psychrophilus TaxID=1826909 RepID=A0A179DDL2_9SPHI|nr:GDP-mannose 4,6-dehydratase [Pedobacter psychrophilus]OAQ38790.1 GDP-mannose 4,6-dehydratase [Pedobacter psychrophilus]